MVVWHETSCKRLGGRLCEKVGRRRLYQRSRCPTVFWNEERQITLVVHGGDLTASGWRSEMAWLEKKMDDWCEIETRGRLDGITHDVQEVTILNREMNWNRHRLSYRADPKRVQILATYLE